MRLIVGLGNPGEQYRETRHNVGERVVRAFARGKKIPLRAVKFRSVWGEGSVGGRRIGLLLPETFMNRSGEVVGEAVRTLGLKPEELLVVHDDIDLPLGRVKYDFDAGAAGHRGVLSIEESLGSQGYHRLRLGIGRPATKEEVESYVLDRFSSGEIEEVEQMVSKSLDALERWTVQPMGPDGAPNQEESR